MATQESSGVLTPPEQYAAAAVFTLALRSCLRDAAADRTHFTAQEGLFNAGGLCQRVYSHLQLPKRTCNGLGALVADDVTAYLAPLVLVLGAPNEPPALPPLVTHWKAAPGPGRRQEPAASGRAPFPGGNPARRSQRASQSSLALPSPDQALPPENGTPDANGRCPPSVPGSVCTGLAAPGRSEDVGVEAAADTGRASARGGGIEVEVSAEVAFEAADVPRPCSAPDSPACPPPRNLESQATQGGDGAVGVDSLTDYAGTGAASLALSCSVLLEDMRALLEDNGDAHEMVGVRVSASRTGASEAVDVSLEVYRNDAFAEVCDNSDADNVLYEGEVVSEFSFATPPPFDSYKHQEETLAFEFGPDSKGVGNGAREVRLPSPELDTSPELGPQTCASQRKWAMRRLAAESVVGLGGVPAPEFCETPPGQSAAPQPRHPERGTPTQGSRMVQLTAGGARAVKTPTGLKHLVPLEQETPGEAPSWVTARRPSWKGSPRTVPKNELPQRSPTIMGLEGANTSSPGGMPCGSQREWALLRLSRSGVVTSEPAAAPSRRQGRRPGDPEPNCIPEEEPSHLDESENNDVTISFELPPNSVPVSQDEERSSRAPDAAKEFDATGKKSLSLHIDASLSPQQTRPSLSTTFGSRLPTEASRHNQAGPRATNLANAGSPLRPASDPPPEGAGNERAGHASKLQTSRRRGHGSEAVSNVTFVPSSPEDFAFTRTESDAQPRSAAAPEEGGASGVRDGAVASDAGTSEREGASVQAVAAPSASNRHPGHSQAVVCSPVPSRDGGGVRHSVATRKEEAEEETGEEEATTLVSPRCVLVLWEVLQACVGGVAGDVDYRDRWYDARARKVLRRMAHWLSVPWPHVANLEAFLLSQMQSPLALSENPHTQSIEYRKQPSKAQIGAAAAAGATILAACGLVPALAGIGLLSILVTNPLAMAGVGAGFGAYGAVNTGCRMKTRVADVREFKFQQLDEPEDVGSEDDEHSSDIIIKGLLLESPVRNPRWKYQNASATIDQKHSLSLTICVSGYINSMDDFMAPWLNLKRHGTDRYTLVWESARLLKLRKMYGMQIDPRTLVQNGLQEGLVQAGQHLMANAAAVTMPTVGLLMPVVMSQIDNRWSVAGNGAEKAGLALADQLLSRVHGDRPVTLLGYSHGARLIFKCLLELSHQGCAGIVEDVFLVGTPVDIDPTKWSDARAVVAGRLINAYSHNDWALRTLHRAYTMKMGIAGLEPVRHVPGVENVNLSRLVNSHSSYPELMPEILDLLGLAEEKAFE